MDAHVTLTLPVLSKGATSGTVRRFQQMLNVFMGHGEEGSPVQPLQEDGVFGPATEQIVKNFQRFSQGHGKVAFMQPEAALACAVGRGGGDGWPLLCCPGRPGAGD